MAEHCQVEGCTLGTNLGISSIVRAIVVERDAQPFGAMRLCSRHAELTAYIERTTDGKLWCDDARAAWEAARG